MVGEEVRWVSARARQRCGYRRSYHVRIFLDVTGRKQAEGVMSAGGEIATVKIY